MVKLTPNLDSSLQTPIYMQLYEYIKREIIEGHLEADAKLPSIRYLAKYLKISRTTIEAAYGQLYAEGYILSKPKVGYFVNIIENNALDYNYKINISKNASKKEKDKNNTKYDLMNDYIDKDSFNFKLWKRYLNKVLSYETNQLLTYGHHQGEYELRCEISKYVHQSRGVVCTPEQIIIGSGTQSLLNILCGIIKNKYINIGFEDPGFNQARHIFKDHDFNIIPISMENDGIDMDLLNKSSAETVYVSPSHQFPLGSVMTINKRIQLLNWAKENNGLIIEDDYDSELRYYGRPIPSLQGLNEGINVIYLGSFSKILLPSIRISYMIIPKILIESYETYGKKYNQTSSKIEQLALSFFIKDGQLEKHIKKVRKIYAKKNQLLTESIDEIMKDKVKVLGKETGLHILLEIKSLLNSEKIVSSAEKVGVKVTSLSNYFINTSYSKYPLVLLAYGGIPIEDIKPAVILLNQVWFE